MKKRGIALLLVTLLAFTMLAGCGQKAEPADTSTESTTEGEAEAETESEAPAEASGEVTVVNILHHYGEQTARDNLDKLVAELEKQDPSIHYEIQALDFGQFGDILKTKIAGGDAPDIFFGRPKQYADLIAAGHVMDLEGQPFLDNVYPEALESMKVDGKVYGVPSGYGGMGIFFNRDVFKEHNIEIPKSHEELMAAAKKFEEAGIYPFARGYKDGWPTQCEIQSDLYGYAMQQNPKIFEEIQSGEKKFADYPEFRDVVQRTGERLAFDGGDAYGTDSGTARNMLITGEAAMMVSGNWEIGEFVNLEVGEKIGFFATPNTNDANPVLGLASDGSWLVYSQTEVKDAAFRFIDYFTTPEGQTIMNSRGTDVPTVVGMDEENLSPLVRDIIAISEAGGVYNYEAEEIFTGQHDATFRAWQEEFAADPDRDVDNYIEKLDAEISAIQP